MVNTDIHLDDLIAKRDRGESVGTRFLNEAEKALVTAELNVKKEEYIICGGYDGCIRARVVLPAFWESRTIDISEYVTSVKIKGSGYKELSHSDFLGSLTGCGISRNAIGDIVVSENKYEAVVFCTPDIASFLLTSPDTMQYVGRDKVKITAFTVTEDFSNGHGYKEESCFVSSLRADAVVGAVCKVSRENAKLLISSEKVTLNYICIKENDTDISVKDTLSIRGKGKYIIDSVSQTKKGRIRLNILKFI